MKITLDTNTGICKIGSKEFKDVKEYNKNEALSELRNFIIKNSQLSNYEEDCMWMSYRYCIGRHTIASHMHASDIWYNCKNRLNKERQLFTAFDINREIEMSLAFMKPYFHFPLTSLNRIYTSAIDIVCQFLKDYDIKSKEELIKYRDVNIILSDNERGYKFETITWEEYLRPRVHKIVSNYYRNDSMSEDYAWEYFEYWKSGKEMKQEELIKQFKDLTRDMPNFDHYYLHDLEDLFVWNDLVHCFDYEHHHKSLLINGEEVEWFWSWTDNTEEKEPNKFYKSFGYHRIRIPINQWNGSNSPYIPDSSIKKDLY